MSQYVAPLSVLLLLLTLPPAVGESADRDVPGRPPNIIFILADDLGFADLSCYGQEHFQTPHIDRMAVEGLKFTQHYAGNTVCAPSRAALLSGRHTGRTTVRGNGQYQWKPDPNDISIGRMLKDAGYLTAMIGKSGLSCNSDDGDFPNEKGFDHFFGFTSHAAAHRYYPRWLWRNGEKVHYPGNFGKEGDTYSGDLFHEDAMQFLEQAQSVPFFLHLSLQQPHADLAAPDKWREKFIGKFEEEPYPGQNYRAEEYPKSTYAAMVTHLDHTVGAVLEKLEELGIANDTLVIFSSDNGAMSEGGWKEEYFNSSGPLRGGKRDLYEGGLRVPTIAWWPGTIRPGRSTDHVSAHWDFVPTACELAGASIPEDTDGVSYVPTLLGSDEQAQHEYLYWEFHEQGGKQAVRWNNWKAVRLNVSQDREGPIELYDLDNDLGETNNIAAEHPEVVAKIKAFMREAHEPSEIFQF